jgi:ribosomal subunit interface protein
MQIPLQLSFRHIEQSDALEADIRERAKKLDEFFPHIMNCRVVVEALHKSHHQGNLFRVRLDVSVPGKELVAGRAPKNHKAHEDAYVTVRDAFNAMYRQLEEHSGKIQQEVKTHEEHPHGWVSELLPEDDYGRIRTFAGRDIYFHRNSVTNANFDDLKIGDAATLIEELGEKGPQATAVFLNGGPGH